MEGVKKKVQSTVDWSLIAFAVIIFFCCFWLPFSFILEQTSSDNLADAIQFLREFDHEAAEMCNW